MNRLRLLMVPLGLAGLTLVFFWKILLTNLILSGVDVFTYFYPYRDYAAEALRQGRWPLWNPYLFLGVPFLANSQAAVLYPLHWPLAWLSVPKQIAASIGLHIFLGGVFAYLFARRSLRTTRLGAFIGAVLFAFGGFLSAQVEHLNQLNVSIWLPLLLLLWDKRTDRRCLLLAGGVVALMLLAGHTQAAYICFCGWGVYALIGPGQEAKTWPQRARALGERLALLALVIVIGAGLAAVQLLPTLELAQLSNRAGGLTYQEASSFSLRPQLLAYTLLPSFGEDLAQVFGNEAFSEYVAYLGVMGLFLALIGALFCRTHRYRMVWIVLMALGLFLAVGRLNPAYRVLYKTVPGLDLFRAPARWMLLYILGGAMLAALGADFLLAPLPAKAEMAARPVQGLTRWAWRRLLSGGAAVGLPFVLLSPLLDFPALPTRIGWAVLGGIALALWVNGLSGRAAHGVVRVLLPAVLLIELFAAGRGLAHNRATAPEALSSLRTAPAHLLVQASYGPSPPSRFLSLSDIRYDPGDLADIQALFADQLPAPAIYDLVVAAKRKEILAPNLPLYYRLPAVDGYDGGLLPLRRYVTLQRLFLDADRLSPDGRLREQLEQIPPGRLLSMLNVAHVITDKVHDVWIDGVFYDLEHQAVLGENAAESVTLTDLPEFAATALGVVSYLEHAEALVDGQPVAELILEDSSGGVQRHLLRAGIETAEGVYQLRAAKHAQAQVGHIWRNDPQGNDYITRLPLAGATIPERVVVRYLAPVGRLYLRGLTLIDERLYAFYPLTVSTAGHFRLVHSGDVKVYQNLDVLPRAYVVHQAQVIAADEAILARLLESTFDPARGVVLAADGSPPPLLSVAGNTLEETVSIVRYEPERVIVEVDTAAEGYLVLSDTFYPGWRVVIDGQEGRIYRANLLFRAVYLSAGRHTVEFEYRPGSLSLGAAISGLVFLSLASGLLLARRLRVGAC
ncbi:MAG: YfhO family protein [Chloroflexota bacterium]